MQSEEDVEFGRSKDSAREQHMPTTGKRLPSRHPLSR